MESIGSRHDMQDTFNTINMHVVKRKGHGWLFGRQWNADDKAA